MIFMPIDLDPAKSRRIAWASLAVIAACWFPDLALGQSKAGAARKSAEAVEEEVKAYAERIDLALARCRAGNFQAADTLLDQCPATHRGWEWTYAKRQANAWIALAGRKTAPKLTIPCRPDRARAITFSQDGSKIAAAMDKKSAMIVDARDGRALVALPDDVGPVLDVAFSPDGKQVVLAGLDGRIQVRDVADGRLAFDLIGHVGAANAVGFHPDGRQIASTGADGSVRIWDVGTHRQERSLTGHVGAGFALAFSPRGNFLASGGADGSVRVWDSGSGAVVATLLGHKGAVRGVAFNRDGRRLASAGSDGQIKVWEGPNWSEQMNLTLGGTLPTSITFSADDRWLASAGSNGSVTVWDALIGREALSFRTQAGGVEDLTFARDGLRLVTAGGEIKVWELEGGRFTDGVNLKGHTEWLSSVSISPDNRQVAAGSGDGTVLIWNPKTGQTIHTLTHPSLVDGVGFMGHDVEYSPNGRWLAVGSNDSAVLIFDARTGREVAALQGHETPVFGVAFSPDGLWIASGSMDKTVKIWSLEARVAVATFRGHTDQVKKIAFAPNGRRVASASMDKTVKIWDLDAGKDILTLRGHSDAVWAVAFSPDGRQVASASKDETVKVWDAANGSLLRTMKPNFAPTSDVAFSPDGRRIISASWSGTYTIWDSRTGLRLIEMPGGGLGVYSPDGSLIATGGEDNAVVVRDGSWQAPAKAAPSPRPSEPSGQETGFLPLFTKGDPLKQGWTTTGSVRFVKESDDTVALVGAGSTGLFWLDRQTFDDYTLKLDYQLATPDGSAALVVRFPRPDAPDDPERSGYSVPLRRSDGVWTTLQIVVKGREVAINVNGSPLPTIRADRPDDGYLGFLVRSDARLSVRKIQFRPHLSSRH